MCDENFTFREGQLPFIFVNGQPKSLRNMTCNELVRFIKHLLRMNIESAWWPSSVVSLDKFFHCHDSMDSNSLRKIVLSCYKYYGEMAVLYASEKLGQYNLNNLKILHDSKCKYAYGIYEKESNELLVITTHDNLVSPGAVRTTP